MLYKKASFMVREFVSTELHAGCPTGVRFEADGSTVATCDGHVLVRYTPKGTPPAEEWPVLEGFDAAGAPEPFTLEAVTAATVEKAIPKAPRYGHAIVAHAALDAQRTNADSSVYFATNDLNAPQRFQVRKMEGGAFPNYERVMPQDEPAFGVTLNVAYLRRVAAMLERQGFGAVRLDFFALPPVEPVEEGAEPPVASKRRDRPVRFTAANADGEAMVLLMPMYEGSERAQ